MPNANYIKGRRLEWQRRAYYQSFGYCVVRSAGSKSPWDLIVIVPNGVVTLIQLKRVSTEAQAKALIREFEKHPPLPKGLYVQMLEVHLPRKGGVYYAVIERCHEGA